MQKAPLARRPLLRFWSWFCVAYFAESFTCDSAKFSGRYADKMDDKWTEIWLSKRSFGISEGQEGR
jgi:hypothetical protein